MQEQLRSAHLLAVKDCIDQAEKLAELHEEITECDNAFAVKFNLFCEYYILVQLNIFILQSKKTDEKLALSSFALFTLFTYHRTSHILPYINLKNW